MKTPLRRILAFALALPSLPCLVHAAAVSPPGVNLRWDKCYGDGGVLNRSFACDTNQGTEVLVGSFELAEPMSQISGVEFVLDLGSASPTLPAWWGISGAGGGGLACRPLALTLSQVPPAGASACVDWAQGQAAGGIARYSIGLGGVSNARLLGIAAVPQFAIQDLQAGQEYFLFRLLISHLQTVGTGACTGCDVPVCIFLSSVDLQPSNGGPPFQFYYGANWSGSQYVTWPNGYPTDIQHGCSNHLCFDRTTSFTCVPYSVTSSRPATWGAVKSLYR